MSIISEFLDEGVEVLSASQAGDSKRLVLSKVDEIIGVEIVWLGEEVRESTIWYKADSFLQVVDEPEWVAASGFCDYDFLQLYKEAVSQKV